MSILLIQKGRISEPFKHNYQKELDFFHCVCLERKEKRSMKKTKMMKKNYEFKNVLSKGNYYSGKYIEAFIKRDNRENINFLGIAIGVKLAKAVQRNHIKRLIRENYQFYEDTIKSGYRIVFLWKKKADVKASTFQNIKQDMKYIFDKAKMIEEKI